MKIRISVHSPSTLIQSSALLLLLAATSCNAIAASITDLGTLGGDQSRALGINSSGQVVGGANNTLGGGERAFLYSDGIMTDLGTFGGNEAEAKAINDTGQIVGWYYS